MRPQELKDMSEKFDAIVNNATIRINKVAISSEALDGVRQHIEQLRQEHLKAIACIAADVVSCCEMLEKQIVNVENGYIFIGILIEKSNEGDQFLEKMHDLHKQLAVRMFTDQSEIIERLTTRFEQVIPSV
jgi:hypothetical protein